MNRNTFIVHFMVIMEPIPIDVRQKFEPLHSAFLSLIKNLDAKDWKKKTSAGKWTVADVTSHLLDGDLRVLSIQRDGYYGDKPPERSDFKTVVTWLNKLNHDWVKASKRLSPDVLILLIELTGPIVTKYFKSLDPMGEAVFPVSWAGESKSFNWMHVAREYTERWHHQQQIREATGQVGIMTKELFYPVIDTFMRALPVTFKGIEAINGTKIQVLIEGSAGGEWHLKKGTSGWVLVQDEQPPFDATVTIPQDISWKLFCKNVRPPEVMGLIAMNGDKDLALRVLEMVSVMA
ncbi:MAG: maleylpyruvate isomerase N-terminal domain-containing protein [Cyclobacteriaceae bacterium]